MWIGSLNAPLLWAPLCGANNVKQRRKSWICWPCNCVVDKYDSACLETFLPEWTKKVMWDGGPEITSMFTLSSSSSWYFLCFFVLTCHNWNKRRLSVSFSDKHCWGWCFWLRGSVFFGPLAFPSALYNVCSLLSRALGVVCKLNPTINPGYDSSLDRVRGSHT